ncbi:hypothetical protein EB796_005283 [Bugula neritina]|uniref:Uncharacterized protein n=1 Tax=Bugula neritina TaxID=10212 RepID=A0A7J7KEW6_BUGNE|nr:hypothetical protein EB796_005283 [Bugula neritina]
MKVEVEDYLADMKDHNYAMKINYFGLLKKLSKTPLTFRFKIVNFIRGGWNLKPVTISTDTIGPGEMGEAEMEITAKRAGDCVVISSFECEEMGDIQGQRTYKVKKE